MVTRLPMINIPTKSFGEYVQEKQHKENFNKDVSFRTKCHHEVVYSDVCGPMHVDTIVDNKCLVTFINDHSRKL